MQRNSQRDRVTVINPRPQNGFIETTRVKELTERAIKYIKAGYPVHLSGPTGCGKSTLGMHIAYNLGRPMVLINGDEESSTSSLLGSASGYRRKKVVDHFVSRVYKLEESMSKTWIDERLTVACKNGFTLIYNEFTRSRPEANNTLLSVLEEGILELPGALNNGGNYVKVHPDFSAIFTSNPEEYAGVFKSQDALLDRMITIDMGYYDEETEIGITQAKSDLSYGDAKKIVRLIRDLRESDICEFTPTLRSCIMIARSVENANEDSFMSTCVDVLSPKIGRGKNGDLDPITVIGEVLGDI